MPLDSRCIRKNTLRLLRKFSMECCSKFCNFCSVIFGKETYLMVSPKYAGKQNEIYIFRAILLDTIKYIIFLNWK